MSNPLHDILYARLRTALPRLSVVPEASWKDCTTTGTGTATFFLIEPSSVRELQTLLMVLREFPVSARPLGAGSNFIGSDRELSTVFLRLKAPAFSAVQQNGSLLECGAAIRLSMLAAEAAKLGFGGLAPLCGIPGTLGGAVRMNAGANRAEISQFIQTMKGFHLADGAPYCWEKCNGGWAYRTSPIPQDVIITSVTLELNPVDAEAELAFRHEGNVEEGYLLFLHEDGLKCGSAFHAFRRTPQKSVDISLRRRRAGRESQKQRQEKLLHGYSSGTKILS